MLSESTSQTGNPGKQPLACVPWRKGVRMKITIEKNLVEFVPEKESETAQLEKLWSTIVDCVKFNKKLTPIGEYVPQKSNTARFAIEG